ncbi:von Willebrand and RING finger domain protein [Cryomyces antarcticus]
MAGILDVERSRTRRERTFVGTECAVCEEPLEHTLRGERILQLSCTHVSHEACFYEYIRELESQTCPTCDAPLGLDTSRGGNIDFEKLNSIVRSVQGSDQRDRLRSTQNTPTPWDTQLGGSRARSIASQNLLLQRDDRSRVLLDNLSNRDPSERVDHHARQHGRNDSGATGVASSEEYAEAAHAHTRRHDYDVQSMELETSPHNARTGVTTNSIPPPTVTIRSEFPTLNRSRQPQSLTCLITVEVVEGKWRPLSKDFHGAPSFPSAHEHEIQAREELRTLSQETHHTHESQENLDEITENLHNRVDNWHGLDFSSFGKLRLHGTVRVSKDRQSWQDLECYLFSDMLICVKDRKLSLKQWDGTDSAKRKVSKCSLKGSILIQKHLKQVESSPDDFVLTLSLSVAELPQFHLQFPSRNEFELWRKGLRETKHVASPIQMVKYDQNTSATDEEDCWSSSHREMSSSAHSSHGASKSHHTAPTEYTHSQSATQETRLPSSVHVPLDIVVVVPVSSSMLGLKLALLRDSLRFLVNNLGERDRMGLVTFGSSGGGVPLVGMTTKAWKGWPEVLSSIRPVGQKSLRADEVEGANVAMDLLMQRKSANPISSILLISDSSVADSESVDFVVSRAEAAKIAIHSFGLGLTHKPDTMIELSTRTKASYLYVKDWMMLRECVAGCLGSLQSMSHQNVKLKLRLPEGSPAKFAKISGALQITKRATGRGAEASLGDLRFGDKRDILVQLAITPDPASSESLPQDPWESIVSDLQALGGSPDHDESRTTSIEEVPLLQVDLTYGDILREAALTQLPRPSLLAITMLPSVSKKTASARSYTPPIPPHPSVVQRRMEILTSDMLTRALTLVSRGQHDRARHLLSETRSILKGLSKGGLPPLPPPPASRLPPTPTSGGARCSSPPADSLFERPRSPSPHRAEILSPFTPAAGIDPAIMTALDAELDSALEWINHPAVFGRDSRKAVLQAIGVVSSQRGYTFRTQSESLWAGRIAGVKRLTERSREWREAGDEPLMEEV